jgi:hypothetical protein
MSPSAAGTAGFMLRLPLRAILLTIWYTVTESPDGLVVIVVQYVKTTHEGARRGLRSRHRLAR